MSVWIQLKNRIESYEYEWHLMQSRPMKRGQCGAKFRLPPSYLQASPPNVHLYQVGYLRKSDWSLPCTFFFILIQSVDCKFLLPSGDTGLVHEYFWGNAMSLASKIFLATSCGISAGIIGYVHIKQQIDRWVCLTTELLYFSLTSLLWGGYIWVARKNWH